jgi:hypothetical protein
MSFFGRNLLYAGALAAGTFFLGWWTVPVAALVFGALQRKRGGIALIAAEIAIEVWTALLIVQSVRGARLVGFGEKLGASMGVPVWALFVATLAFPALLASCAASLGAQVASLRDTSEPAS